MSHRQRCVSRKKHCSECRNEMGNVVWIGLELRRDKTAGLPTVTPLLRIRGQSLLLEAAIAWLEQSSDHEQRVQLYDFRGLSSRARALERAGKTGRPLDEARNALATLIGQWRQALTSGTSSDLVAPGLAMGTRLCAPLEPFLEDVSTLQLSPDGVLALLPLGALPGRSPDRYLLEDYAISLVPVPQLLAQAGTHGSTLGHTHVHDSTPSLLVLGDVDLGASPGSTSLELVSRSANRGADRSSFDSLPETRLEIDAIAQRFHHTWPRAKISRFAGSDAIESRAKPVLSSHSILHFSTHGVVFADPTGAEWARHIDMLTGLEGMSSQSAIDPRSRVGLALAGANHPLELGLDDGTLTALEVKALDLRNVDLVVMSACESAIGTDAGGEGMLGLQRAFQAAGARCHRPGYEIP